MPRARLCVIPALVAAAQILAANLVIAHAQGQRPLPVSVSPASIGPGDVVRIDVPGASDERITATLLGQNLTFVFDDARGAWRALAGVDVEAKPATYQLRIRRGGAVMSTRAIRVTTKRFAVRRLRVPAAFVNPPPEALKQIALDSKTLAAVYARNTPPQWSGAFILPVDGTPTSNFGTRSYYNGSPRAPHSGVDFMSEPGTPIRASNHGSIALAAPLYFTGNTVIVDHGARLFSVFAHLSAFQVAAGDIVTPETIVGLVGATGRVTGPHLHWSVSLNDARVDPLLFLGEDGEVEVSASPSPAPSIAVPPVPADSVPHRLR
jgi:murein DD-endopeptidase MepM/ murein hydrolase activator NlpD